MPSTVMSSPRWDDLTDDRRERVRLLVVDALALAAAGTVADDVRPVLRGLRRVSPGPVPVPWTELRLGAPQAATALSSLIHAWDFDDTHDEAVVHTTSVVLPAALAAFHTDPDADGRALLDGVVTGIQVLSRLARLTGPRHGVIRTAGLGAVAAAATAATVWRLSDTAVESAAALSLVSSLAPTTRQAVVDGSVAKRVQPGIASAAGVTAAALAAEGVSGPAGWLGGTFGLLPASTTSLADLVDAQTELDQVALKPYPACRYTHAALAAAEQLHARHREPGDLVRVVAHLPAGAAYALVARPYEDRGAPLVDAQFSLPWQIAALWVTGRYDLTTLREDLGRADVARVARLVEVRQDLPESIVMSGAEVDLHLRDGSADHARAAMPGSAAAPLDRTGLDRKVRGCLTAARVADVDASVPELWRLADALPGMSHAELATALETSLPTPALAAAPA